MATPLARDKLLGAVVEAALRDGIADLSLREIAAAIGTSHRMLIYHFDSREGLLIAVVREVERRERQTFSDDGITIENARVLWQRLSAVSLRPQERLFFEIYAHALLKRAGTEGFLEEVLEGWIGPVADTLIGEGLDPSQARALARLCLAVTRGLLLDLVASGDSNGTTQAFELFIDLLKQASRHLESR